MQIAAIGEMSMPAHFRYRSLFLHGRPRHEKQDAFFRRHPPMDPAHRAKIFSAFDALAGFSDAIAAAGRAAGQDLALDPPAGYGYDDVRVRSPEAKAKGTLV